MKKFERFIIYPMLFISLFFSFADDGMQTTTAQRVYDELIAKSIKIVDDKGSTLIELNSKKNEYLNGVYGEVNIGYSEEAQNSKIRLNPNSIHLRNEMTFFDTEENELNYNEALISSSEITFWNTNGKSGKEYKDEIRADFTKNKIKLYNKHGDELVYIGKSKNKHGLINIYDKYGEDWKSYSYK